MAYTTIAEMEAAFGAQEVLDLVDRDRDGVADAGVLDAAIADAGDTIDSYLRSRFQVPLADAPGLIRKCARFIVRYNLSEDHATDRVKDDHKQALAWLDRIRKGEMDVGLTEAGADIAPAKTGGPQFEGGRDAFPEDALNAWTADR